MRALGILLMTGGIILLIYALVFMDTSVYAGYDIGRVNNIGLMSQRQNYVIVSSAAIIIGLILFAIPYFRAKNVTTNEDTSGYKKCPQCAEQVKAEAKICRFCNYTFTADELEKALKDKEQVDFEMDLDYMKLSISDREKIMVKYGLTFNTWTGEYIYKDCKNTDFKTVLDYAKNQET